MKKKILFLSRERIKKKKKKKNSTIERKNEKIKFWS